MRSSETISASARIETLDTSIFAIQPGHYADRTSFLRVQRLLRSMKPGYQYLEIGSDLGGSLLPHLLDPDCRALLSFDPRPQLQPDERGRDYHYAGNSTERMLRELRKHASPRELGKLVTIDADISDAEAVPSGVHPDLVLVDGEHTNVAAFSDFMAVLPLIAEDALVTFHDANLISDTLQIIERLLVQRQARHSLTILPSCVAVFAFGALVDPARADLAPYAEVKTDYFAAARDDRHAAIADAVIGRAEGLRASDISGLRAWTENVEQQLNDAKTTAGLVAERKRARCDEVIRLRQEIARLERQAETLIASTSWKLTAPVRAAGRLLKGQRA
jgi:hypothetical protein